MENYQKNIKEHNELQKQIEKKRVYLPQCYSCRGTIDPSECLKEEVISSIEIKANLFGPICPEKYFSTDFRVLWLLKESYITEESFDNGDRGGHNQAEDRNKEPLGEGKGDATYKKIIETVSWLVKGEKDMDEEVFRTHTCILNVNVFPALCGSHSNDNLIAKWADINKILLEKQLALYKPTVIICGFTLQHFFPCNIKHNPYYIKKYINENNGINLLGYDILNGDFLFMDELYENGEFGANYAYWNNDVIFIDAYHPANPSFKSKDIKRCYDDVIIRRDSRE